MDAAILETKEVNKRFRQAEELGMCPECGAVMNEVDHIDEGLYTFIWFECSKSDCNGQWLQKKPNSRFVGV